MLLAVYKFALSLMLSKKNTEAYTTSVFFLVLGFFYFF